MTCAELMGSSEPEISGGKGLFCAQPVSAHNIRKMQVSFIDMPYWIFEKKGEERLITC
jgi:hypothetical protein